MKKNLIKKVFAVSLSIAMACSFLPTANPVTASAAAPYVSLKTTFKTLKVGQTYKMTLKNNTINWKIRKVETTNKPVATVYGKTASQVMIKGKSEGRATIRVHVRTTERKRNNTKTLRCRVKVVPASDQVVTPVQTEATVTTQAELTDALNNANLTKINIKAASGDFTIPEGTHSNVDLVVDAPQSDIENSATFKSIQINNIKPETWTEKGKNNTITVNAPKANIVIGATGVVNRIKFASGVTEAKVTLNGGTLNGVTLSAKIKLNIGGTKAANTSSIPVEIEAGAADSEITTDVPADIRTGVKISVVFEKNATGSTLTFTAANITAAVTNRTGKVINITRANGSTIQVPANASNYQVSSGTTSGGGTTTPTYPSGGGSTGGSGTSSVDKVPYQVPDNAFNVTTPSAVKVASTVSGAATITTKVNIERNTNVNIISGASVRYQIQVSDGKNVQVSNWKTYDNTEASVNEKIVISNGNADASKVTIKVSFCYLASSVYKDNTHTYAYDSDPIVKTFEVIPDNQ